MPNSATTTSDSAKPCRRSGPVLALLLAAPALAGAAAAHAQQAPAPASSDQVPVQFEADRVQYDDSADTVTASGHVVIRREDQSLSADAVRWDRKSSAIVATGHVHSRDANGNETFADRLTTTDALVSGTLDNVLVVLREGGRLVAGHARRDASGGISLSHAAYSSCDVVDEEGCPVKPSWRITARSVFYDPHRVLARMYGARMVFFGVVAIPLPKLEVATDGRSVPGLLIPNVTTSSANGFGFSDGYFVRLGPNRDLTLTGTVYTKAAPLGELEYRALTGKGAYQITGYLTTSNAIPSGGSSGNQQLRGYVEANGQFQLSPVWNIAFSGRLASDRTFLQRYYINYDDVLRSTISATRVGDKSLLTISGWAFETLRPGESQGQVPIALPEIDWRRRWMDIGRGGTLSVEVNSLALSRSAGQDTQRAFATAQWALSRITPWGQRITFTGLLRGDLYHTAGIALTTDTSYNGVAGWHARGEALAALDVTWPLAGKLWGGTQVLTPHVQLVAVPPARNAVIPDEDSRAIELSDDNLFALNRNPGHDRIEDGAHVTYGVDWIYHRRDWEVTAAIGQSARLTGNTTLFENESGLSSRVSDIVGRVDLRWRDFFRITDRFRIDHGNFTARRNEVDATIGSDRTYVEVGYARTNNLLATALDDVPESNELRGAVRVAFAKYWSVFGSGVFDLTRTNLVASAADKPFQPLRTRLGVAYQSDCFEADVTWRKDYVTIGDAVAGSSFLIHFSLRNIGAH